MDTFEMIRQCAQAQWRAYSPREQQYVNLALEKNMPALAGEATRLATTGFYPLWQLEGRLGVFLMSIKVDEYAPTSTASGTRILP